MLRKLLPKSIRRALGQLRHRILEKVMMTRAKRRLNNPHSRRQHDLPGELIVSLTSYPARFGTLHLTLGCLLDQTIKADRTILWIAYQDVDQLPSDVRNLESRGLEIRTCDDLRSYKKLIPALEAFPKGFIATADDDIYYPPDWLELLVAGYEEGVICCHRAHRPVRSPDGSFRPYMDWQLNVQDLMARQPSTDLLATSGAGALYAPGSLAAMVSDRSTFQRLCPDGDDLWFHWCAKIAGTRHKKVGGRIQLAPWPGSQPSSLWSVNEHGGNDRMVAALHSEFGYPD